MIRSWPTGQLAVWLYAVRFSAHNNLKEFFGCELAHVSSPTATLVPFSATKDDSR